MFASGILVTDRARRGIARSFMNLAMLLALTPQIATPARAGERIFAGFLRVKHVEPEIATIDQLARSIDEVDRELYSLGIVSVKSPDIWTQNRMTKYRREYEAQMSGQLDKFELVLSALTRRADIAALTTATGIRAAAPSATSIRRGVQVTVPDSVQAPGNAAADTVKSLASTVLDIPTGADSPGGGFSKSGINLEPTVALDERSRYIYHLQQLSRINAGDDKSDLPGYGLYLIRMPVSVLPGKKSDRGKGAMVTVEAKHHVTPDLLQTTFRNVLVLDTAYELTSIVVERLYASQREADCAIEMGSSAKRNASKSSSSVAKKRLDTRTDHLAFASAEEPVLMPADATKAKQSKSAAERNQETNVPPQAPEAPTNPVPPTDTSSQPDRITTPRAESLPGTATFQGSSIGRSIDLEEMLGEELIDALASGFDAQNDSNNIHAADVLNWLTGQLDYVYDYFARDARRYDEENQASSLFCHEDAEAIRHACLIRDWNFLCEARAPWLRQFDAFSNKECGRNVFGALAYALVLRSAFVNEDLKADMEIAQQRRHCGIGNVEGLKFYALRPPAMEREAFMAYVMCKWPIHVFSLDPMVDQQNSFDLYSERSSLQMALAVAVATGQVKFDQAISYARQIETDIVTVGLNRTAVGFGAGETTFGWKLFPRVQTPPISSNAHRASNLLLWGGNPPNYDVKSRKIEPGPRECVALVVMPNFVPTLRFTTTSNWFDLAGHCVDQMISTQKMLELSRKVQRAKQALVQCSDISEYRDGEMERLQDRIAQLEAMLPMQDFVANVPNENDLGAAEIFRSDAARLAPVLIAWYGEPVMPKVASDIFVLAKGLSVLETQIIVGGKKVEGQIISRNVLRVPIPADAQTIDTIRGAVIDVHIATPNGISNHLYVETLAGTPVPPVDKTVRLKEEEVSIAYKIANPRVFKATQPTPLNLTSSDPGSPGTNPVKVTFTFEIRPSILIVESAYTTRDSAGKHTIAKEDATTLMENVFTKLLFALNPPSADIPTTLKPKSITYLPLNSKPDAKPIAIANNLTINFTGEVAP